MEYGTEIAGELKDALISALEEERAMHHAERARLEARIAELEARAGVPPTIERFSRHAARELAHDGITIVPDFLAPETCDEIRERLLAILGEYPDTFPYEDDRMIQFFRGTNYRNLDSYGALVACPKPVLVKRGDDGDDAGLLDVFKVDHLIPELAELTHHPVIHDLVEEAAGWRPRRALMNAYVSEGCEKPRGFHVDSYGRQYKAFVYLTDVPDTSFGPYCYMRGSHRADYLRFLNMRVAEKLGRSPTDAPFVDPGRVVELLGPRGTLAITNQSGIHRGQPQAPGRRRVALVISMLGE